MRKSGLKAFDGFLTTIDTWLDPITNYFLEGLNSGFVEGFNNRVKVLKRRCYGTLKDKEAAAYLDAVFEDGTPEEVSLTLRNIAEARRTLPDSTQEINADWEKCYQSLKQSEMPALSTLLTLLSELGLKL